MQELKNQGYGTVYVWRAEPAETDPLHAHPYETQLVILTGAMTIIVDGQTQILTPGQRIVIPANQPHEATVGPEGCDYIVAEGSAS